MNKTNLIRSIKVALFVGTILNLINNYQVVAQCDFSLTNICKVLFTYMVPFLVSFYSAWKTSKE
ncbi:MAG: nitrate/nitrite transporter NrtS [Bacteroidia bacterium]